MFDIMVSILYIIMWYSTKTAETCYDVAHITLVVIGYEIAKACAVAALYVPRDISHGGLNLLAYEHKKTSESR